MHGTTSLKKIFIPNIFVRYFELISKVLQQNFFRLLCRQYTVCYSFDSEFTEYDSFFKMNADARFFLEF